MDARERISGLDALRGLAIALVLVRHAWPHVLGGAGIAGVVMFFALSGYLITSLLVREHGERGHVDFAQFYRHRFLRLFPALLLLLAGFVLVTLLWDPIGDRHSVAPSLVVAIFYLADLPGLDHGSIALGHLWTLAVEEQFYLLWPAVVVFAVRRGRLVVVVLVSGVVIYAVCAASLVLASPIYERVYWMPASWSVALVIGAAACVCHTELTARFFATPALRRGLGATALCTVVALSFISNAKTHSWSYLLMGPVIAVCTVILIFWARDWQVVHAPVLRLLVGLGTISYATYLWDYPVVVWLSPTEDISAVRGALTIPVALALATISWWVVERPISRVRRRLAARGPTRDESARPGLGV